MSTDQGGRHNGEVAQKETTILSLTTTYVTALRAQGVALVRTQ